MMTTETIIESGLIFGPFSEGYCFYIEKSDAYEKINKQIQRINQENKEGVKIAEFLLIRDNEDFPAIWIVEAKSSAPHPKNKDDFDKYIKDICDKFVNSLILTSSLKRNPNANDKLSENFKQIDIASVQFVFALVINGFAEEWIADLQDQLQKVLKPTIIKWSLSSDNILVLNQDGARHKKLIL